jgi:hypothetical protein
MYVDPSRDNRPFGLDIAGLRRAEDRAGTSARCERDRL